MKTIFDLAKFWTMLSSEKSLAYWQELNLPITMAEYEKTQQFARGCLEIIISSQVRRKPSSNIFQDSWRKYREESSILSDKFLSINQIERYSQTNIAEVTNKVAEFLTFSEVSYLNNWFDLFFRYEKDSIIETSARLEVLLELFDTTDEKVQKDLDISKANLNNIRRFCNRIRWRNIFLDNHFSIADNVYRMNLPNQWEMVLQDCFFEGDRNSYWWMNHVKYSLQFVNFYERWDELKAKTNQKDIDLIIKWLEKTITTLADRFWELRDADLVRIRLL